MVISRELRQTLRANAISHREAQLDPDIAKVRRRLGWEWARAQLGEAEEVDFFPATLEDIDGWFLDTVVMPMTPTVGFHSMVFLGGAGLGESLVARVIAMAMSRHILRGEQTNEVPSFRAGLRSVVNNNIVMTIVMIGSSFSPIF